ncbi:serine/threonine protein kinase, partial [bacterium]|nr:serine/threonine protein kinase [candidate division CSSED10-310 bacterium]
MAIESGTTFNSLQVIDKLGKGGNCEVFRARDTVSERLVALKILLDSRNVLRFRREFRSMSHLDHLNIAKVYDYGEYEGKAYFTMEFIDGGDLKQFILRSDGNGSDKTRFVPKTQDDFTSLSKLFLQICEPLKYIHSQKIIHRDLKPANIMLTREGVVKLMDFGLIKELDVIQESLTQTGTFVGTVNYMSPEQGLCRNLDHRSDIYSLGIIL